MKFLTDNGERLARVATSGMSLTDDLKARILSTFLTLMNLRENLDRASMRGSVGRSGGVGGVLSFARRRKVDALFALREPPSTGGRARRQPQKSKKKEGG